MMLTAPLLKQEEQEEESHRNSGRQRIHHIIFKFYGLILGCVLLLFRYNEIVPRKLMKTIVRDSDFATATITYRSIIVTAENGNDSDIEKNHVDNVANSIRRKEKEEEQQQVAIKDDDEGSKMITMQKDVATVVTSIPYDKKKTNINYKYYQHLRKCGGSVGKVLINNTTGRDLWNEFHAFPSSCVDAPEANETLFFTMLRDPADRYASEFRYKYLHHEYNLTGHSAAEEVQNAVRHWINKSSTCMNERHWGPSCFNPNIYTRLFSGRGECRVYNAPENATGSQIFWKWSGSPIPLDRMTEKDFLVALYVLKKFDLVLTTKRLGPSATEQAINAGFNVSRTSNWNATEHATKSSFNLLSFEGVREIIEEYLQWDIKLFQYFDSRPEMMDS